MHLQAFVVISLGLKSISLPKAAVLIYLITEVAQMRNLSGCVTVIMQMVVGITTCVWIEVASVRGLRLR